MGKVRRRGRRVLWVFGIPVAVSAAAFSYVADNHLVAAGVGAVIGLVIGFAIMAFPNLDRGGPEDSDDMFH
jgi:ElaB/YqjD/DUF883 family membrane-anchored ribosome-binding protein